MTLFSDPGCHYSHRVRIALAEKGVSYDLEEYTQDNAPAELGDLNPYHSFPTLLDRDLVLYDSQVMLEYLDERYPHPPLLPIYPDARARSRLVIHQIERDWSKLVDALMDPVSDVSGLGDKRKELAQSVIAIASEFSESPYFGSEEFTLVDCCLAPIFWRLTVMGIQLPKNRQTKPLWDYMTRVFTRPAFQQSLSSLERDMPNIR
jgi:RNA polymerase-associated protein